jgi:hypothetical protein
VGTGIVAMGVVEGAKTAPPPLGKATGTTHKATKNNDRLVLGERDIAIQDGKIDGNNLSFAVTFDFNGMPFTLNYKGVLASGEIKFTVEVFGMTMEVIAKKSS